MSLSSKQLDDVQQAVLNVTNARKITGVDILQSLWSGYGVIIRFNLSDAAYASVIVKHIQLDRTTPHPRGWDTDHSHQRKLRSYAIEETWYRSWAVRCDYYCQVAECIALIEGEGCITLVLEDLDNAGFPARKSSLSLPEAQVCLKWLANFHALYLGDSPVGLWPIGTYWHLDTRPDEWSAMADSNLKRAAQAIDKQLNDCRFQTIVHGDAKVANFCFSIDGQAVAAVDFQYVGSGCGMKDVAYFLGSCFTERECAEWEPQLLNDYFAELHQALKRQHKPIDGCQLEAEWRRLYPFAWADFDRFLLGWMPTHRKLNAHSREKVDIVLSTLSQKKV